MDALQRNWSAYNQFNWTNWYHPLNLCLRLLISHETFLVAAKRKPWLVFLLGRLYHFYENVFSRTKACNGTLMWESCLMKLCSGTSLAISPIIASYIIPRRPPRPIRLVEPVVMSPTWPNLGSHWRIKTKQSSGISRWVLPCPGSSVWIVSMVISQPTRPTNVCPPFHLTSGSILKGEQFLTRELCFGTITPDFCCFLKKKKNTDFGTDSDKLQIS